MRGDFDSANELLPSIPIEEYTKVARFLESQGFKEEALQVTQDHDHKFDLALELGQVETAHKLLLETPEEEKDSTDTQTKWKRLSDAALKDTNLELCEAASISSNDYSGLLLLYSATGNYTGMERLAQLASAGGKTNVAFVAHLLTGNVEACADLLIATKRLPEAAFFVRTYLPSRIDEVVSLWKKDLASISESAANALASPSENKELFPDMDVALQIESMFISQRQATMATGIRAVEYMTAKDDLNLNLIDLVKGKVKPGSVAEESKVPEPETSNAEEENEARIAAARAAAEAEAQAAAEAEARAAAEEAQRAAEEAMRLEEEARAAAEAAAAAVAAEDQSDSGFGDDW
jgi:coatomer subunit beta'